MTGSEFIASPASELMELGEGGEDEELCDEVVGSLRLLFLPPLVFCFLSFLLLDFFALSSFLSFCLLTDVPSCESKDELSAARKRSEVTVSVSSSSASSTQQRYCRVS